MTRPTLRIGGELMAILGLVPSIFAFPSDRVLAEGLPFSGAHWQGFVVTLIGAVLFIIGRKALSYRRGRIQFDAEQGSNPETSFLKALQVESLYSDDSN